MSCRCAARESTNEEKLLLVAKQSGDKEASNIPLVLKAETEVTTRIHYDDVVPAEKQIDEGSFGIVFRGRFRGEDVAIKKMKDIDASIESMAEFEKEVDMLGKFRCDEIVHFYGACFVPNHVMMVTEYAPCGSLADATKELPEQPETVKARHWACTPAVADSTAKSQASNIATRD